MTASRNGCLRMGKARAADLTYACHDGMWTRFYPETDAGEEAWLTMARADPEGAVAFLETALPGVLAQLRAAGLTVRKAPKSRPMTTQQLNAVLSEIDGMISQTRGSTHG